MRSWTCAWLGKGRQRVACDIPYPATKMSRRQVPSPAILKLSRDRACEAEWTGRERPSSIYQPFFNTQPKASHNRPRIGHYAVLRRKRESRSAYLREGGKQPTAGPRPHHWPGPIGRNATHGLCHKPQGSQMLSANVSFCMQLSRVCNVCMHCRV